MKLILLLQFLFLSTTCISQAIRDVKATQRGNTIVITYDFGPVYQSGQFDVSIFCSTTGGKTWQQMSNVSGDVGERVDGGLNKQVIWDVLQDRASLIGDQITFEVRAKRLSTIISAPSSLPVTPKVFEARTITGIVTDENGEPLIGSSIVIRGTTQGTLTDLDGAFSLDVPAGNQTLVFSYVGFDSHVVELGAEQVVDIVLSETTDLFNYLSLGPSGGISYTPIGINVSASKKLFRHFYFRADAEIRSNFRDNWIGYVNFKIPKIINLFSPQATLSSKSLMVKGQKLRSFSTDFSVIYSFGIYDDWLYHIRAQGGLGYNTFSFDTSDMAGVEQKNLEIPLRIFLDTFILLESGFRYRPGSTFHELQFMASRYVLRGLELGIGYEKITNTSYQDFLFRVNYSF